MNWLIHKIKIWLGYRDCSCGKFLRPKWHQICVTDLEDEPPLFGYWSCGCGKKKMSIQPTKITENAVAKLGYENFEAYYEKAKEKENE